LVFPAHLQSSSKFFIGHIQVTLRLLDARMAEHQLNDPDVHAVGQEATGTLVPEVMPSEIDAPQSLLVPLDTLLARLWLEAVGKELQRFPRRLNRRLVGAAGAAEDVGVSTESRAPLQDGRPAPVRVERNPAVLPVLGRCAWDPDLTGVPVDAFVLNQQHLAATATQLQRADDAIVQ
jgi:hypothetical protein